MKKNQVYFAIPLVVLVVFIAYYWNFRQGFDRIQAEKAAVIQKAKDQALQEQNRLRLRAVQETLAGQERRKAEKAAKDAAEQKKREDRQAAYQARDQAQIGIAKWRERFERLTKEVQNTKEQIAKIEQDKATLVEHKAFLEKLTQQTEVNVEAEKVVLDKIEKSDAAWAAAVAAAKAAAAQKKS